MQIFKKVLGFLFRLVVIDSILLACTWIANMALAIKGTLAPYAISMKTSDILNFEKVTDNIVELQDSVYEVYASHTKGVDKDVNALREKIEELTRDFYEVEDEEVVSINRAALS